MGLLDHTRKTIREALKNNCFYVYWHDFTEPDKAHRVFGVKTEGRVLKVQIRDPGYPTLPHAFKWQGVAPADTLDLR